MESLAAAHKKDKTLHHAYLLSGERESAVESVCSFLEKEVGVKREGNPDFLTLRYDTLTIDNARELKSLASRRGFAPGKKIFIVAANFFTREAQNALLKLFEEPSEGTHFFIVTEHAEALLPTLRSRLAQTSAVEGEADKEASEAALRFAAFSPAARLEEPFIRALIEEKDKEKASRFIDALTAEFRARASVPSALVALLESKRFIRDRSASVKLIVERLALTLPVL